MMIVLSIDSGLERTGYSIFHKTISNKEIQYITSGLVVTKKNKPLQVRIFEIYKSIKKIIDKYIPNIIIIEQLFFFKNQKTVINVSQSQGAILLLAAQNNISVDFLTPLEIKETITGYGYADKKSVQKMLKLTLNLDKEIKIDDVADAVACGLAYCYRIK